MDNDNNYYYYKNDNNDDDNDINNNDNDNDDDSDSNSNSNSRHQHERRMSTSMLNINIKYQYWILTLSINLENIKGMGLWRATSGFPPDCWRSHAFCMTFGWFFAKNQWTNDGKNDAFFRIGACFFQHCDPHETMYFIIRKLLFHFSRFCVFSKKLLKNVFQNRDRVFPLKNQ